MRTKLIALTLFIVAGTALGIGSTLRTIYTETITTKGTNQDITITPTGTGNVVLKDYDGVLKASTGSLSASDVDLTSEITGILPLANGGTGSATQNFVDLTTNQTIAGEKTFSSDLVVSSTGHIQVPSGTEAQRDGSPVAGMFRHNSDTGDFEGYDGTAWGAIGGDGQGGINYIDVNDFEANAADWAAYADAAATTPADGTGGSPTLTFARNTSSPLRGNGDGIITKDAADRQGEGVGYAFSIDSADQARKLTISFDYSTSANYADDDIGVFIYDVTNTNLIRVNGEDLKAGDGVHYAQFQTAPDSTSYRLILHVASTNASAYTVNIDNVKVGPTNLAFGTIATDWVEYSGSVLGTDATIDSDTNDTNYYYRRVGDSIILSGRFRSVTGGTGSTEVKVTLPSGLSIDSSKITTNKNQPIGSVSGIEAGVGRFSGSLVIQDTESVSFLLDNKNDSLLSSDIIANSRYHWSSDPLPIQGWSSNARMSEDLGGREIVVRAAGNGGTSITADVTDIDFTEVEDTTASWDGDSFTAPEKGRFLVTGSVDFAANLTTGIQSYIDGVAGEIFGYADNNLSNIVISGVVNLEKGEVLSFRSTTSGTLNNSSSVHHLHIQKLASPQTMLETETVAARYTTDAGQTLTASTEETVVFEDLDKDTHGAYNTSTGIYTTPISGWYSISSYVSIAASNDNGLLYVQIDINNGSKIIRGDRIYHESGQDSTTGLGVSSSALYLSKGDTVKIVARQATSLDRDLESSGNVNHFSIARIK